MEKLSISLATLLLSASASALDVVISDLNGEPIEGAIVTTESSDVELVSDSQGVVSFAGEVPDELHVEADGFAHKIFHLHGEAADPYRVQLNTTAIEQVDVVGLPLHTSKIESALPVSVLTGDELQEQMADTLGETLKHQVGVHSSSYAQSASSPIIRGLDGPRVKVTQNSLDVADVSRVGPDHVVTAEVAAAEQVEILRGPATLFYGSGAIGGVVNVVDGRVPTDSETSAVAMAGYNTVANEKSTSLAVTGGGENFALYADGFYRDSGNYDLPDLADPDEFEGDELENSGAETTGFTLGASWLLEDGFVGVSYGEVDRFGGIAVHGFEDEDEHDHEEEHDEDEHEEEEHEEEHHEEVVQSDMLQRRFQFIANKSLDSSIFTDIDARLAYTDYQHMEVHFEEEGAHDEDEHEEEEHEHEEDGHEEEGHEEGSEFFNETVQTRLQLGLQEVAGWTGAVLFEYSDSAFDVTGDEAFTPPIDTETIAVAILQEKHQGDLLWQLGARYEQVSLDVKENEEEHDEDEHEEEEHEESIGTVEFSPISLSAGVVWDYTEGYNLGLSYSYSERATSGSELASFGPHIATNTFEIGTAYEIHEEDGEYHVELREGGFDEKEVSNNIDLSWRKFEGDTGFVLNAFVNYVDNFVYQRVTDISSEDLVLDEHAHEEEEHEEEEHEEEGHAHAHDLAVTIFEQADAVLWGMEAEYHWQMNDATKLQLWGDVVHGTLDEAVEGSRDLPRMPAARLGSKFAYNQDAWRAVFNVVHYVEQNHVAAGESPSDSYTLIDAGASYKFNWQNTDFTTSVHVDNLLDEEARPHTSFVKDQVPLPGRGVRFSIRASL